MQVPKYVSELSYPVITVGVVGEELFPISLYRGNGEDIY
jgi:hypothetical protein